MAYVKKKRKPAGHLALETWAAFNEVVTGFNEAKCNIMLKIEKAHRNRPQFISRLMSRRARARRLAERKELSKAGK